MLSYLMTATSIHVAWLETSLHLCTTAWMCTSKISIRGAVHVFSLSLLSQETVAALISTGKQEESSDTDLDGVPLLDTKPIDFSGGTSIDGVPMVYFVSISASSPPFL